MMQTIHGGNNVTLDEGIGYANENWCIWRINLPRTNFPYYYFGVGKFNLHIRAKKVYFRETIPINNCIDDPKVKFQSNLRVLFKSLMNTKLTLHL